MSLESALAEEAREVVALLEGRQLQSQGPQRNRAASPTGVAQSPVRSMLDIGEPTARHASIAGIGGAGVTRPGQPVRSSMLDPYSPPPMSPQISSVAHRTMSKSPPLSARPLMSPTTNVEDEFRFDILPRSDVGALPKRVTQGGKKHKSSMASVYGSEDMPYRPQGRHLSLGARGNKSMSPGPGHGHGRSQSPSTRMLNQNNMNLMTTPGKFMSDSGQIIDINNAFRRLSDAALLRSGSSLAQLPGRKFNRITGESEAPDGGVRLTKDYSAPDEDVIDDSDEGHSESDADDDSTRRGRGRTRKGSEGQDDETGKPKSLLSAVEEERKNIAKKHKYTSLLEPEVKITGPDGEKPDKPLKRGIHPSTSFDASSEISSVYDSDQEEQLEDLRRAQKLTITLSPVHSTPSAHRCIRQIIRGDYERFNREAHEGLRRQRMYLVATDMSPESEYALEWTIGTVLRDGDTLLAVYAVDEEISAEETPSSDIPRSPPLEETAKGEDVVKDLSVISRTLSNEATLTVPGTDSGVNTPSPRQSNASVNEAGSDSHSLRHKAMLHAGIRSADGQPRDPAQMDPAERQRLRFTDAITDRLVGLLRKTKLQVRVVVEVFHCKSPKHMITEVIDFLSPTLVILGSRGRSALKGVLLGSFSNYLVTKSSVPVMVARKKLRKHSKSVGLRGQLKLSNMLAPGGVSGARSRLEEAKIDKLIRRA